MEERHSVDDVELACEALDEVRVVVEYICRDEFRGQGRAVVEEVIADIG